MYRIASQIVFMAWSFRIAAAIAVMAAIGYGVYVAVYTSVVTGLIWIVGALVCGFVGNMIFGLVHLLSSAMAGSPSRGARGERRIANNGAALHRLHPNIGAPKSR